MKSTLTLQLVAFKALVMLCCGRIFCQFKFLPYDAKFDSEGQFLRDFNETFTEYSLYTEVYINDIDFTLKCINLHTDSNQSIAITEPNTGVAKTGFLEKYEHSVGQNFQ
jgi:hypothetical protein